MPRKKSQTRELLIKTAAELIAIHGYEGVSMRILAQKLSIAQSVIYHYFSDKDTLLLEMYLALNKELGEKRAELPETNTVEEMFRQRIAFQLDNATSIIAVLKYYLHFREHFHNRESGKLPQKTSLHIDEILSFGQTTDQIDTTTPQADAKVITHAINGYLLEYYPYMPEEAERDAVIDAVTSFSLRALNYPAQHSTA